MFWVGQVLYIFTLVQLHLDCTAFSNLSYNLSSSDQIWLLRNKPQLKTQRKARLSVDSVRNDDVFVGPPT